ncbi:MAG: hypothetical protein CMK46_04195 [Porticoccus sp.]|uniref:hypothetical protein n=1 Tax=Porticoccus hydrocarbonoclasticus TaxID=1073414 RepID=UPI000C5A8B80|nr:hypothetical protein [Porticoccus hydrocarbonoclasticus]MBG57472.1 hypothetical protein [Porticoccus sp.]
MSLTLALNDVLAALEAGNGAALISFDTTQTWGSGALDVLVKQRLLKPASVAKSVECRGCEERCYSDVVTQSSPAGDVRAFVVCEVPDKQAEMGRVLVAVERLQQWQCNTILLAQFIAGKLGLDSRQIEARGDAGYRLGMLKSPHGRRWVSLTTFPLALDANQQSVPLGELLFVDEGFIALDDVHIQHLLSREGNTTEKQYIPNTEKRESRKLNTQAMYQEWRDTHAQLLCEHPGRDKTWYARKIARMEIAYGRDYETIRKRLL